MGSPSLRLSRRQALGLAATGAAGAASVRVFGLHFGGSPLISTAGPEGAWSSPLGNKRALAAHLLRRAGFGYSASELDAAAAKSYTDLVDEIINQTAQPLAAPADVTSYQAVTLAWLQQMTTTAAQFPERMTFFWHGHLTSDYRKSARFPYVFTQNATYRQHAVTDLRTLLINTVSDPLMMRYLDLDLSTGKSPNENFSREVMELYTLGVGNYTEDDVREGAKAFAGLRIVVVDKDGNQSPMPKPMVNNKTANRQAILQQYYQQLGQLIAAGSTFRGVVDPARAYTGPITFLGKTGNISAVDAVDQILTKPSVATFIATKALNYFATPTPSSDLVTKVAGAFRDSNYDIKTLMRTIFMHDDFTSSANYRSLVRSPVDYSVAAMRALGRPDLAKQAQQAGQSMDQVLYDMPTVAGWPSNAAWLSSSSVLARVNFAAAVVAAVNNLPDAAQGVRDQLDDVVGADLAAVFNASQNNADKWYALLASPEFQLK